MRRRGLLLALAGIAFALLATANSGGYRYGVSDQAFYTAAVIKQLQPGLYPRDTPLLAAESRLMWSDEIVAGLSGALGVELPPLYLALYLGSLAVLFVAAVAFGRAAGLSWWAIAALILVLTFRHRIARTGANTLEGYMHPRMIAFGLGVLALGSVLVARHGRAMLWTAVAACWHPTTAFWFGLVVTVAVLVDRPHWRRAMTAVLAAVAVLAVWAVLTGPLAGRLVIMDPAWLSVLADKDYLFPHEWPLNAWLLNASYPAVIFALYRRRAAQGRATSGERALVAGLLALAGVFLIVLPFTAIRVALAVQMQVTRVFWVLDFAAAAYVCRWLVDDWLARNRLGRRAVVAVLLAGAVARGAYLLSDGRRLIAMALPPTPWVEAMAWLKQAPSDWHVLADPIHAWKYGVSVRVGAEKDTLVETGKDTALAMYDREVAMNVGERLAALRHFNDMNASDFRAVADRFGVDVLIVELAHRLDLPELYRNRQFAIYQLQ